MGHLFCIPAEHTPTFKQCVIPTMNPIEMQPVRYKEKAENVGESVSIEQHASMGEDPQTFKYVYWC